MAASNHPLARKRPVNLTLSQDVVNEARHFSANLSQTVEELLVDYVIRQKQARAIAQPRADASIADWNALHDRIGSIADELSPL